MIYLRASTSLTVVFSSIILGGCQSQRTFQSPDAAVAALETAVQTRDRKELRELFGPDAEKLKTGDPDVDDADFIVFSRRLEAARKIQKDGADEATLLIGEEHWPFAVPLVKDKKGWRFNTDAGIEELTNRYIGRNELDTIAACKTLIDAQIEYFERDPDGIGIKHYAQRLQSTDGKKDGLSWPVEGNEDPPPIGPVFAAAAIRKDAAGKPIPFHGYSYKLITSQGPTAPGGAMNYLVDGKLTGGWAAIAYPAEYGETGIMSFLFGSTGIVFQKDLGDDTRTESPAMTSFDPGNGWTAVKE